MSIKRKKPLLPARQLVSYTNPKSLVSEQYRTLRTNIKFSSPDKEIRSILITSAIQAEGKSTTAANLAIVFAQEGKQVLIIDADMRKPSIHNIFSVKNNIGLSSVLVRQTRLKEALQSTQIKNLDVLTCGLIPPNPVELLGSVSMADLMEQLKEMYEIIIVDAPPLLVVADSQILATLCEGTVLIISSGETEKQQALKAKEILTSSNSRLIGAVVNNYKMPKEKSTYYYGAD